MSPESASPLPAPPSVGASAPAEIASRARDAGERKARLDPPSLFAPAALAGAFVAPGFEHSIANTYFIRMGLLLEGGPARDEA